jgi:uncharacterized protein (TIGR02271 family)
MIRQHSDDDRRDGSGRGEARPAPGDLERTAPSDDESVGVIRSEEELRVGRTPEEIGRVRARKVVEHHPIEQLVDRDVERAEVERRPAESGDSGQVETLDDGSISIPVFEEQLVVEKRMVVRERVVIRKYRETHQERVEADLRRERVEVDADPSVQDRVET